MSPELSRAIERTKKLFKTRDHADDWGRNIIEGAKGLDSMKDWTLYYSFLTNPQSFDPNAKLVPAEFQEIPPVPDEFEVFRYKNGLETIIEYRRKDEEKDTSIE